MKLKSSPTELRWKYYAAFSAITCNIFILNVNINIDKASILFWVLYLTFFLFFPFLFAMSCEIFRRKYFISNTKSINEFLGKMENNSNQNDLSYSIIEMRSNSSIDRQEEYSGILNRMISFYYTGIAGALFIAAI
jgi:hypothetical protein